MRMHFSKILNNLFFEFCLCLVVACSAQAQSGRPPEGSGTGSITLAHVSELTPVQRRELENQIASNLAHLEAQGNLPPVAGAGSVLFAWPLRAAATLHDPGFAAISRFVDHDPDYPDHLLDYAGGTRTYDLSTGYNHRGTDIFPFPFGWNKMDHNDVYVVAAAAGVISASADGNYDRNCSMESTSSPNYVILRHAGGEQSWYFHMKSGSVTTKAVGAQVSAGEVLGVVGSSGASTGPHLHFEVYDAGHNLIDPFAGPYNSTTPSSWWQSQRPYYDPGINKITIGDAAPEVPQCSAAASHESKVIRPGGRLFATTYYRERQPGQSAQYAIFYPNGSVFSSWNGDASEFYAGSWWYWYWTLGSQEPLGTWRFRSEFNGETYEKSFQVCSATDLYPAVPQLSTPAANARTSKRPRLKWSDVRCARTYNAVVRIGSRTGTVVCRGRNLSVAEYQTKTLSSRRKYFWQVSACYGSFCRKSSWRSFSVR
jgi:murein DD-endopeptidase MepM/ murein hydrolase activator NlpD